MASAAQSKRMKAINTLRDDPSNALAACRLFNLSTIGPELFRRRRLQRYFSDLDYDHGILTRMLSDNTLSQLNLVEIIDVLARFGMCVVDSHMPQTKGLSGGIARLVIIQSRIWRKY